MVIAWLVGWDGWLASLVGWLAGCLVGLVGLVGWVDWWRGLVGWWVCWLVGWLLGWLLGFEERSGSASFAACLEYCSVVFAVQATKR